MNFTVEQNRIFALNESGDTIAEVTFPDLSREKVEINRTFVDESLRGQGIAGMLMKAAYIEIKRQGKKALPTCSFAVKWFETHPECTDIIA